MTETENNRTGVGCDYVNVLGQLTHPELLTQVEKDMDFPKWTEISLEDVSNSVGRNFWFDRKDKEVDLLDPKIYKDVPKRSVIDWLGDYDLTTRNQLETVLLFEDGEIEAIAITTAVYFPFPEVSGVRVFVDTTEGHDIDLVDFNNDETNLDHYERRATSPYCAPELDPEVRADYPREAATEADVALSEHLLDLYYDEETWKVDD